VLKTSARCQARRGGSFPSPPTVTPGPTYMPSLFPPPSSHFPTRLLLRNIAVPCPAPLFELAALAPICQVSSRGAKLPPSSPPLSFPHSFSFYSTPLLTPPGPFIFSYTSQQGSLRLPCFAVCPQDCFARCCKLILLRLSALTVCAVHYNPKPSSPRPPPLYSLLHNTAGLIAHTALALLCCLPFVPKLTTLAAVLCTPRSAGDCCGRFSMRKENSHVALALLSHLHTPQPLSPASYRACRPRCRADGTSSACAEHAYLHPYPLLLCSSATSNTRTPWSDCCGRRLNKRAVPAERRRLRIWGLRRVSMDVKR
jgi:hypothetical protein